MQNPSEEASSENDANNNEEPSSENDANNNLKGLASNEELNIISNEENNKEVVVKKKKNKLLRFFIYFFLIVFSTALTLGVIGCAKFKPTEIDQFYLDSFTYTSGKLALKINIVFESGVPVNFKFRIKSLRVKVNQQVVGVDVDKSWYSVKAKEVNRLKIPLTLSLEDGVSAFLSIINDRSAFLEFSGIATYKVGALGSDANFKRTFEIDLKKTIKDTGVIDLLQLLN